jgi:hypothetical protein
MSKLSELKEKIVGSTKAPNFPEQRQRLLDQCDGLQVKREAANAEVVGLEEQYRNAILDAHLEDSAEAKASLAGIKAKLTVANEKVHGLDISIQEIGVRIENLARDHRNSMRTSQLASGQHHARKMLDGAKMFSAGAEQMVAGLGQMIESTGHITSNLNDWPHWAVNNRAALMDLIAKEMFRLSKPLIVAGALNPQSFALPGSKAPSMLDMSPDAIEPLAAVLERLQNDAFAELRGKKKFVVPEEPDLTIRSAAEIQANMRPVEPSGPREPMPSGPTRTLAETTALMSKPKRTEVIDHRKGAK